ncbi:MAG: hypothetical protein ABW002_15500 [Xanthomonas sp.]
MADTGSAEVVPLGLAALGMALCQRNTTDVCPSNRCDGSNSSIAIQPDAKRRMQGHRTPIPRNRTTVED